MKITTLFTVFAFLPLLIAAQSSKQIVIGRIDNITSKILNEKRKIWVYVPNSEGSRMYKQPYRYPVIYVLDGDDHFHSLTGLTQFMSNQGTIPPLIVVAIPNTNRNRDLTPTPMNPFTDPDFKKAGGGEKFTDFIEKELIPYVDDHYPTQPYRVFIGHSLGGLMVVNTLLHRPELFRAYLAIDPSMWWNSAKLVKEMEPALARPELADKTLFVSLANSLGINLDTAQVNKGIVPKSFGDPNIRLAALLKSSQNRTLRASYTFYKNEDHGSVPLPSEYDGLRFIFSRYKIPIRFPSKPFFDPAFKPDSALIAYYKDVSQWMGYMVLPPESLVNDWGYFHMRSSPQKSLTLFKLNIANYPGSPNVYTGLADYFAFRKDTANAVANFQKALSLKDDVQTRQKLTDLQVKPDLKPYPASQPQN